MFDFAYKTLKPGGNVLSKVFKGAGFEELLGHLGTMLRPIREFVELSVPHEHSAVIAKLHAAKIKGEPTYSCWGTGSALREFLYSDDLADAAMCLAEMSEVSGLVNVGYGSDVSIRDLVYKVAKVVGYRGDIVWDASKPDGTPRKILDSSHLRNLVPWTPKVSLDVGLPLAYQDFLSKSVRT